MIRTTNRRFRVVSRPVLVRWQNGNPVIRIVYVWNGRRRQVTKEVTCDLLLPGNNNTKLRKGSKIARFYGLSLSPAKSGGIGNACGRESEGCEGACLDETGLGFMFQGIHVGRALRTAAWFLCREWFVAKLSQEIDGLARKAAADSVQLAIRLNVFSDVWWEKQAGALFETFPDVQFYDYTKHPERAGALAPNYWVTFSRSEANESEALDILRRGGNVTVVFDTGTTSKGNSSFQLPATWKGYRVIDGDISDDRWNDPRARQGGRGYVIGLKLKSVSNEQRDGAVASGFAV